MRQAEDAAHAPGGGPVWAAGLRGWLGVPLEALWRVRWVLLGAAVALHAAGYNGRFRVWPDSALFANLGRSLANGRGMLNEAGVPREVPRGMPLVFSWLGGPTGGGHAMQLFMLACTAAVVGLTFLVTRRVLGERLAWLVTLGVALNRLLYEMSLNLLSEIPFTVGLLLVLLGHEGRRAAGGDRRALLLAWAQLAAGFAVMGFFRSVAVVVLVVYAFSELFDRATAPGDRRGVKAVVGVSAAALLAAYVGSPAVRDDVRILLLHLSSLEPGPGLGRFAEVLRDHLAELMVGTDLPAALALPAGAAALAGAALLWGTRRLWFWLVLAFTAQWVVFLPDRRYALPLLPLLLVGGLALVARLATPLPPAWRGRFAGGVIALAAAGNLVPLRGIIADQRAPGGAAGYYAAYHDGLYLPAATLAAQARARSGPEAVIAAPAGFQRKELAALAGRRVVPYSAVPEPEPPAPWAVDLSLDLRVPLPGRRAAELELELELEPGPPGEAELELELEWALVPAAPARPRFAWKGAWVPRLRPGFGAFEVPAVQPDLWVVPAGADRWRLSGRRPAGVYAPRMGAATHAPEPAAP